MSAPLTILPSSTSAGSPVNSMFTGSSGSLGEFRAGAVAAALGAVPSALIGGLGTIAVMLVWMWAFPQLRRVDKLTPEAGAAP